MTGHVQPSQKFIEEVTNHLETYNFSAAITLFNDEKNRVYLKNSSWDLIPVFCNHITKEAKLKNIQLASCCERLLEVLAAEANPEEGVLEFLDQIDDADPEKFRIILKLLRITLFREITNRLKSLEWTLNSIRSYTEQYSYDENADAFNSQDDEDTFFTSDKVTEIEYVMNSIISFYEHFVQEAAEKPGSEELRCLLSSRLIQIFDLFLPYVNVDLFPQLKVVQWKVIQLILQLISNPLSLLEYVFYRSLNVTKSKSIRDSSKLVKKTDLHDVSDDDLPLANRTGSDNPFEDEMIVSNLAYGMFFYTLLNENEYEHLKVPMVYNPKYILLSLIYVTVPFFDKNTDTSVSNGLMFLNLLLSQLNDSLTKSDLYFSSHKDILMHLNNVMVYSQIEHNRKLSLKCFKKYIESFNWEGRYLLLLNFRSHVQHSGTLGFLIGLLKEFVSTFLELPVTSQTHRKFMKYYTGKLLFDIIKKYCFLTNGSRTDLVENADHVVSSLNALRYLVLRDKKNITDVKNFIKRINKDYLVPLKENITWSKKYYDLKLKDLDSSQSKSSVASASSDIEVELAVKGQTLPKLTKEQQKTAYHSCLNAIDLIDSLLSIRILYSARWCATKSEIPKEEIGRNDGKSEDQQYESSIREKILNASLQFVPIHGWSKDSIVNGAESIGYPGIANGIFPSGGADLINFFYVQCNQKLKDYMIDVTKNGEKPVDPKLFIQDTIEYRLRMLIPYIDKWPQAIAIMSLPPNVPVSLANLLTLIDDICFFAGDKSVDFNWYTRRIGVGGLYKMTELYMVQDKSHDYEETWKFLARRLSEAIQIQQIVGDSTEATSIAKDVVAAAFTTARNILRLNVPR